MNANCLARGATSNPIKSYQAGFGRLYAGGKWVDEIDYEIIPQEDSDLDGFLWSRDAQLPVSPVSLLLQLDGASFALIELVRLTYQRLKGKYQYGLRILPSDAPLSTDMPQVWASKP